MIYFMYKCWFFLITSLWDCVFRIIFYNRTSVDFDLVKWFELKIATEFLSVLPLFITRRNIYWPTFSFLLEKSSVSIAPWRRHKK